MNSFQNSFECCCSMNWFEGGKMVVLNVEKEDQKRGKEIHNLRVFFVFESYNWRVFFTVNRKFV